MKFNKKLKNCILGASLILTSAGASAQFGGIVYDPSNWVQNNSSALSNVKNEINTARALIQQTQTAINMAKSIKGVTDMAGLAQMAESLTQYRQLQSVDTRLQQDFQRSAALTDSMTAGYGASSMSWNDYLASRRQLEQQQRETSAQRYSAINASIDQTSRQRQAIVAKLGAVGGQTEAMQTLGASIDVLIGQNQQIISILAANNRVAEMKQADASNDKVKGDMEAAREMNSYQQRLLDAAGKY